MAYNVEERNSEYHSEKLESHNYVTKDHTATQNIIS